MKEKEMIWYDGPLTFEQWLRKCKHYCWRRESDKSLIVQIKNPYFILKHRRAIIKTIYLFKERKQSYKNQTSRMKMNGKIMNFQQQGKKYVQRSLRWVETYSAK